MSEIKEKFIKAVEALPYDLDKEILKKDTEISTKYLPETDVELLNNGVKIIGKTKLIEFLEDYE